MKTPDDEEQQQVADGSKSNKSLLFFRVFDFLCNPDISDLPDQVILPNPPNPQNIVIQSD